MPPPYHSSEPPANAMERKRRVRCSGITRGSNMIVVDHGMNLPDGTPVDLEIVLDIDNTSARDRARRFDLLAPFAGTIRGEVSRMAESHDEIKRLGDLR